MKSKWATILLVTSLAVNLALAGYLVGSRALLPGVGMDPTRSYPRWVQTLPEERRDALRSIVHQQRQDIRPALRSLRQQHRALRNVVAAQPLSPEDHVAALGEMRGENARVQKVSHRTFVEFVTQLTDIERQQLAEDMRHPHRGFRAGKRPGPHPRHNGALTPTIE